MNVRFDDVSKNYGLVTALKKVDFEIKSGEFVFLSGPSGAGKTTIIKLILGQIFPTSGNIYINDVDVLSQKKTFVDFRRQIGVVFQDYQLIQDKSIEENISLALEIVGFQKNLFPVQIDKVLDMVGLSQRRFLFPNQLSAGEKQRACLARAMAVNPKLILADEPTGNLDIENSWKIIKIIQDFCHDNHSTVIVATHNHDFVNSMGKRVISFESGSIKTDDKPDTMSEKQTKNQKVRHLK